MLHTVRKRIANYLIFGRKLRFIELFINGNSKNFRNRISTANEKYLKFLKYHNVILINVYENSSDMKCVHLRIHIL